MISLFLAQLLLPISIMISAIGGLPSGKIAHQLRIDDDKDLLPQYTKLYDAFRDPFENFIKKVVNNEATMQVSDHNLEIVMNLSAEALFKVNLIHQVTGLDNKLILAYNLLYETMCTTSVIRNPEGNFMMGRNLDFFYTAELSQLVIEVSHYFEGKLKYIGAGFFGFITYVNISKPGQFMLALNERFFKIGGFNEKLSNLIRGDISPFFLMLQIISRAQDYFEAINIIKSAQVSSPCYFIICSDKFNSAVMIGRSTLELKSKELMNFMQPTDYLLVQANSDPIKCELSLEKDKRRACVATYRIMEKGNKITVVDLLEAMSAQNVRTKLTVYTSIMADHIQLFSTYIYDN